MKRTFFTIIIIACIKILYAAEISPTDPNIQYVGRFDMTTPSTPVLSWPGSQMNIRFEGTSLKIKLSSSGLAYYWVQIDNSASKIALSSGSNIYTLASGLTDGAHTAKIIKVSAPWTPQTFQSIILDDGKTLLTPPARKTRKIEFYGDSQTQGAQVEITGLQTDGSGDSKDNNYFSYASITARALNAEYVSIAQSGASLTPLPPKLTIPACYDRTGAGTQYSLWDFQTWTPDVICINLGVNDSPLSNPTNFTATYVDFIKNNLRVKYPNVHIFLLSGPMNNNVTLETAINSVVSQLNTDGDNKVYYFKPSRYIAHSGHPRTVDNVFFAQELAAFITTKTWTTPLTGLTPEEVYITPINTPLAINSQRQLTAVVSPFDASNQGFTWTSLNPEIATVSSTGVVTGVSTGTAIIKAIASNGVESFDYELKVSEVTGNMILNPGFEDNFANWNSWGNTVINTTTVRTGLQSLELSPAAGGRAQLLLCPVEPNTTYTYSAWFKIMSGTPSAVLAISYTHLDGSSVWLQSTTATSTQFEQKVYTFTTPGDVFSITAIIQLQSAGTVIVDDVELIKGSSPSVPVPVTGVTISGCQGNLAVGNTMQLSASIAPADAFDKSVVWSTSNTSVATVDAITGVVTAVAAGTADITVTSKDGDFTDVCAVTVVKPSACNSLTLQAEDATIGGGTVFETKNGGFNGTGYTNFPTTGGYVEFNVDGCNGGNFDLSYRYALSNLSTDRTGLLVVNGVSQPLTEAVTGDWIAWQTATYTIQLNAGNNTIRFESNGMDFGNLDEITITGSGNSDPVAVTGVSVSPSIVLTEGTKKQLSATITPLNADDQSVVWSTSNASVATIDASGVVTAVALGAASITVTTNDGGFTDVCEVNVTSTPLYYSLNYEFTSGYSGISISGPTASNADDILTLDIPAPAKQWRDKIYVTVNKNIYSNPVMYIKLRVSDTHVSQASFAITMKIDGLYTGDTYPLTWRLYPKFDQNTTDWQILTIDLQTLIDSWTAKNGTPIGNIQELLMMLNGPLEADKLDIDYIRFGDQIGAHSVEFNKDNLSEVIVDLGMPSTGTPNASDFTIKDGTQTLPITSVSLSDDNKLVIKLDAAQQIIPYEISNWTLEYNGNGTIKDANNILLGAFNARITSEAYREELWKYWDTYQQVLISEIQADTWSDIETTVDGWDWSLPEFVTPATNALLNTARVFGVNQTNTINNLPAVNFDTNPVLGHWVFWKEFEATEGVYDFEALRNNILLAKQKGYGSIIRLLTSATSFAPAWMANKGIPLEVQDPNKSYDVTNYEISDARFHSRYLALVEALGNSGILNMPEVKGIYVGYKSPAYGDEGIGPEGKTPEQNDANPIVTQRLDAWVSACSGIEHKVYMGGISYYGIAKGFGIRRGFVENYLYEIPSPKIGQLIDANNYLYIDETNGIINNNGFHGEENEEYHEKWATAQTNYRYGESVTAFPYRNFSSNLRLLQMRCSYLVNAEFAMLPGMLAWVGQELGRTETDAPDAWCALRESYLNTWYHPASTLKNFERWVYQRDQVGYETTPAMQIPHGHSMWMIDPNKRFDYIARKGKKMGFDVDDAIFPGKEQPMAVKVSYHDAVAGTLTLKYEDANGVKTKSITTTGQDKIKTSTFFINAKTSHTNLDFGFDLIIESVEEVPVCFIRVVKTQETYYDTAITEHNVQKDSSDVLSLYPNPTDNLLNIDFDNISERIIKIFNMDGHLIYTTQTFKQSTQINLQALNIHGVILIQVQSESAVSKYKILVK